MFVYCFFSLVRVRNCDLINALCISKLKRYYHSFSFHNSLCFFVSAARPLVLQKFNWRCSCNDNHGGAETAELLFKN